MKSEPRDQWGDLLSEGEPICTTHRSAQAHKLGGDRASCKKVGVDVHPERNLARETPVPSTPYLKLQGTPNKRGFQGGLPRGATFWQEH